MTIKPIVHVVDDDPSIRESLTVLFESVGHTVRTYNSADAFLDTFHEDGPGCLIVDVRMPGLSGLQLQQELNVRQITLPVIVVSGHGDIDMAVKAMRQGAVHFLKKPFNKQEVLDEVNSALARHGEQWAQRERQSGFSDSLAALTPREREIAELIVEGKSSKAIARDLDISDRTVDAHRGRILAKFGVRTALELMALFRNAQS